MTDEAAPSFEIGFVLAGAVSAGAYTAGVMDFVIEALEAYYAAKRAPGWRGPSHELRIPVIAGASAGGMTGSIVAIQIFHEMAHVNPDTPEPGPGQNYLYESWVQQIDISKLLATVDLAGSEAEKGVKSILCSRVIDDIVDNARDRILGKPVDPQWIGRDAERALRLRLTLSNMRGVPYAFNLYGQSDPRRKLYGMLNFGDYRDFKVGLGKVAEEPGTFALNFGPQYDKDWVELYTAAKATGAFPIGLAPRRIGRAREDYRNSDRVGIDLFRAVLSGDKARLERQFQRVSPPDLFFDAPPGPYDFVAVDGGVIDNEPLELARRFLAGASGSNERSASRADKAVVMVAPFPNFLRSPEFDDGEKLVDIAPRLLGTAIGQARFKPDELELAADPTVYSRFLVAPQRLSGDRAEKGLTEIACGAMGGFSGFLHKSFRRHDYLLGRRNAQAFLRWHFNLSEDNPLFGQFPEERRAEWYVREVDANGREVGLKTTPVEGKERRLLPIVPLTEKMKEPIVIPARDYPDWEALEPGSRGRAELDKAIRNRATAVVDVLVDQDLSHFIQAPWPLSWFIAMGVKKFAVDTIEKLARKEIDKALGEIEAAFAPERNRAP